MITAVRCPQRKVLVCAVFLACALPSAPAQSQKDDTDAGGYDTLRIEQEDKLLVPPDKAQEVWEYVKRRLTDDPEFLHGLDPEFTSSWAEELFHDTYFDTPSMQLYEMQSGVRYRYRVNLTNPDDRKSGRELMQIKLNGISDNSLERGELKFDIERPVRPNNSEDRHPLLGLIKQKHREPFKARLREIGLNPLQMQPILTIRDLRRRVYVFRAGQPFLSISLDRASSEIWGVRTEFCEIEPELNEIVFTEATPETRAHMETVLQRLVADIQAQFPDVRRHLTPKYNKAFDQLQARIPGLRLLVAAGLHDRNGLYTLIAVAVLAVLGVAAASWFGVTKLRSARARRRVTAAGQSATNDTVTDKPGQKRDSPGASH